MDEKRLRELSKLCQETQALPAEEQETYLESRCGEDRDLREEATFLLGMGNQATEILAETRDLEETADQAASLPAVGTPMGHYVLREVLGSGGMGTVFLAEQQEPVQRQVALKVLKTRSDGTVNPDQLAAEMQALAVMNHRYIAKVFDTGFTSQGQPFFAMEWVPGEPITRFCDRHQLTLKDRLRLFIKVCYGLHHAHQKGIVHRDIKPANILVTMEEADEPVPKIIDFGIARATKETRSRLRAIFGKGMVVGTPAYMSPEQILNPDEIDTRSDVFSLGVLLYELLVGTIPYDAHKTRSSIQLMKLVCDGNLSPPSARLSQMEARAEEIAQQRRTSPSQLKRVLAGDLCSIVLKAVARERDDRYGSVIELINDIRSWLDGQIISAHAQTTSYRVGKFVRRHALASFAATMAIISVISGLALATHGYVQSERSRKAVAREAEKARVINAFLTDMFAAVDPEEEGRDVKVMDLLENSSRQLEHTFANQPEILASLRQTLGATYSQLGQYDRAAAEVEQGIHTLQNSRAQDPRLELRLRYQQANTLMLQGKYEQSARILQTVLQEQRTRFGDRDPNVVDTAMDLAVVHSRLGKNDEAAQSLASLENQLALETDPVAEEKLQTVRQNRAVILESQGQFDQAASIYEDVLRVREKTLGPEHPKTLITMNNLADVYRRLRQLDKSRRLVEKTVEIRRNTLGAEHPLTLASMHNLASLRLMAHDPDVGPFLQEIFDLRKKILGPGHPDTLSSQHNLFTFAAYHGQLDRAEALAREILDMQERLLGKEHPNTLLSLVDLGRVLFLQKGFDQALQIQLDALEIAKHILEPNHWRVGSIQFQLAETLLSLGRVEEALPILESSLAIYEKAYGQEHPTTQFIISELKAVCESLHLKEKTSHYQSLLVPKPENDSNPDDAKAE